MKRYRVLEEIKDKDYIIKSTDFYTFGGRELALQKINTSSKIFGSCAGTSIVGQSLKNALKKHGQGLALIIENKKKNVG